MVGGIWYRRVISFVRMYYKDVSFGRRGIHSDMAFLIRKERDDDVAGGEESWPPFPLTFYRRLRYKNAGKIISRSHIHNGDTFL